MPDVTNEYFHNDGDVNFILEYVNNLGIVDSTASENATREKGEKDGASLLQGTTRAMSQHAFLPFSIENKLEYH